MTDARTTNIETSKDPDLVPTRMASIRTDLAVIRTGFTIASFGAGLTEFIGRNNWPDWTTDLLTAAFILVGMSMVQSGLNRTRKTTKALRIEDDSDPFTKLTLNVAPWVMQLALLVLLFMILFH